MMRRLHLPLTLVCGALVATVGVLAGGPAPAAADDPPDVVIDEFTSFEYLLLNCQHGSGPLDATDTGPGHLGGELDVEVSCATAWPPVSGDPMAVGITQLTIESGSFAIDGGADPAAFVTTIWDGPDTSPRSIRQDSVAST